MVIRFTAQIRSMTQIALQIYRNIQSPGLLRNSRATNNVLGSPIKPKANISSFKVGTLTT